ncbi:MAG: hypothetical protein HYU49_02145, partial [Candidatus Levybacteria bacterium]|nr:hypothetical protein [Candidatus Levybacteria bacterium]MBI3092963.1 hypothetical protein [Candidatus Levybacteria bacterium]
MRKEILLLFLVIAAGLLLLGVKNRVEPKPIEVQPVNKTYQTQENSQGEVGVAATPVILSSKENTRFSLVLTTHSVDLDYDIKELSILTDDQKNEYKALSWDGGEGGHHLKGTLVFPKI